MTIFMQYVNKAYAPIELIREDDILTIGQQLLYQVLHIIIYYIAFVILILLTTIDLKIVHISCIIDNVEILNAHCIQFATYILSEIDAPLEGYHLLINYNLLKWDPVLFDIFIGFVHDKVKIEVEYIVKYIEVSIRHDIPNYHITKEPMAYRIMKIISNGVAQVHTHGENKAEISKHLCMVHIDYMPSYALVNIMSIGILICLIHAVIQYLIVKEATKQRNQY